MKKKKSATNKKEIYTAGAVVCCSIALACVAAIIINDIKQNRSEAMFSEMQNSIYAAQTVEPIVTVPIEKLVSDKAESEAELEEPENAFVLPSDCVLPELGIDFSLLQSNDSPDIYAWVYVPNTKVSYPILQHPSDDTYYLNYNMDGSKGLPGCIYTEKANSKQFDDPLTVVYGHNMKNKTMFGDLHKFENAQFFEENKYFFIYTQEGILVYEIFAANKYGNSHLLSNSDLQNYIYYTLSLEKGANIRDADERLIVLSDPDAQRNIVVLSTCTGDKSKRYLVQGLLLNKVPIGY